MELPRVEVVDTVPLPGWQTPLRDVPANVQLFGAAQITRERPLTLAQFLELAANSVAATSGQGSPWQQAVLFRGFAASPLIGTPQGVSVFQDGVRINEAFGDTVNWDLLPRVAIAGVQLIPGSVPAFGLNTLGGALAITTKDGARYPGASVEAQGGSFHQRSIEFEHGLQSGAIDTYAAGHFSADAGWAQHNPSRIAQFFGKVRYHGATADGDLTLSLADNRLEGTQTLPLSFLDTPKQAYTYPDRNENRLAFLSGRVTRSLDDRSNLVASAYLRRYRTSNFSSNVNEAFGDSDFESDSQATNDVLSIDQRTFGAAVQFNEEVRMAQTQHRISLGASGDFGRTSFAQQTQPANLTADRGTVAIGDFASVTDVRLRNAYLGIYGSDTIALSPQWTAVISGRYNHARIDIADRSGLAPALDGSHSFARFNPAIGTTFHPGNDFTAYATYNEGMRAPTPIELTCADPDAPCKLPNQFLADPPLKAIVSRTMEMGARGTAARNWRYAVAAYRTDLYDDIQFIASGVTATNAGFFQNVGRTRRDGFELMAGWGRPDVDITLRYNHLNATFRSAFRAASPNNSSADANGAIDVRPGNRIPGIPSDSAKLRVDWRPSQQWSIGSSVVVASSQYALSDDNNADRQGRVPGYAVVNVDLHWQMRRDVQWFALVNNALDRRYATLGILGANAFTGPGRTFDVGPDQPPVPEQFRATGTPRAVFVGVRVEL